MRCFRRCITRRYAIRSEGRRWRSRRTVQRDREVATVGRIRVTRSIHRPLVSDSSASRCLAANSRRNSRTSQSSPSPQSLQSHTTTPVVTTSQLSPSTGHRVLCRTEHPASAEAASVTRGKRSHVPFAVNRAVVQLQKAEFSSYLPSAWSKSSQRTDNRSSSRSTSLPS